MFKAYVGVFALIAITACQDTEVQDGRVNVRLVPAKEPIVQPTPSQPQSSDNSATHVPQIPAPIDSTEGQAAAVVSPVSMPAPTPAPASTPEEDKLSPVAAMPVIVGGAFLVCNASGAEALCQIRGSAGTPLNVLVEKAFIISGNPAVWTAATLRKDEKVAATYHVTLPADKTIDVGIALTYDQQKVAYDWVQKSGISRGNLVQDGGFESFATAGSASRLFEISESPFWKIRVPVSNGCADKKGLFEIQTSLIEDRVPGYEGKQWLELDGDCKTNTGTGSVGNVAVYQDLKLDPTHNYMVRFLSKRRAGDNEVQRLKVTLGGKVLFDQETKSQTWVQTSISATAAVAAARIEFEETGRANRYGTLLDAVQVIDLGSNQQILD